MSRVLGDFRAFDGEGDAVELLFLAAGFADRFDGQAVTVVMIRSNIEIQGEMGLVNLFGIVIDEVVLSVSHRPDRKTHG